MAKITKKVANSAKRARDNAFLANIPDNSREKAAKKPAKRSTDAKSLGKIRAAISWGAMASSFEASKGGNVPGVTEDHRYEMLQTLKAIPPAPQLRSWSLPVVDYDA
jgi:hypothetical protein